MYASTNLVYRAVYKTTDEGDAVTATIEEKSTLHVMDRTGDTKVMWSADNPDEVEVAQATFDKLKKKGFLAYTVRDDGSKGEVIRKFDKTAGRIIMSPQMVGG